MSQNLDKHKLYKLNEHWVHDRASTRMIVLGLYIGRRDFAISQLFALYTLRMSVRSKHMPIHKRPRRPPMCV